MRLNNMDFTKIAKKIAKLLKDGVKNNLSSVMIKGKDSGYYYNVVTMTFILIQRRSEMYYLPIEPDENKNIYIFLPYTFSQGAIILVPEEDVEFLGFN